MPHVLPKALTLCAILASVGTSVAMAQPPRMIPDAEAALWLAVGPLNVAGNRSCTAALISPTEAVTAAHCLFNPVTHRRAPPSEIRFVLGQRRDRYAALLHVTATAILPDYAPSGYLAALPMIALDVALLKLSRPVTATEATPLTVVNWPATLPAVDIVGYGRDRAYLPTIRENCPILAGNAGATLLDCKVEPGLSGAPVTLPQSGQVVAVVSALVGTRVRNDQSLVVPIAAHLAELRALLQ